MISELFIEVSRLSVAKWIEVELGIEMIDLEDVTPRFNFLINEAQFDKEKWDSFEALLAELKQILNNARQIPA